MEQTQRNQHKMAGKDVSISQVLENRAKELTRLRRDTWDSSVPSVLEKEIALTLGHIEAVRNLHEARRRSLVRAECYVMTELLQIEKHKYSYTLFHFPEQQKLQTMLFKIEQDRQRAAAHEVERLQGLEDRLLNLVSKHIQVNIFENGHPEHRTETGTPYSGSDRKVAKDKGGSRR